LFTAFASVHYPASLNRMLLLPLYKGKGARTAASSYRPISLIHPLGRWYAVCLNARLEAATSHLRAEGQAGFRAGYRVEDNVAILQTIFEWAWADHCPVYAVFVDLAKAYDSVVRSKLFEALVADLGVRADLVKALVLMYENVTQQVVVDGELSEVFSVDQGVRQGCPASPLVFSLFMDRLEAFVQSGVGEWTYRERASIRLAGKLIPLLLFADDIVLVGKSPELV